MKYHLQKKTVDFYVRLEKIFTCNCDTALFHLTAIPRDHTDTAGRLTKSGHYHVPIHSYNHRVPVADLHLPLHNRTLAAAKFITRLALRKCRTVSINGLFIPMYTTLYDAIHKLIILNQLSKRINIHIYILSFKIYISDTTSTVL
jgi:hypothetical protein